MTDFGLCIAAENVVIVDLRQPILLLRIAAKRFHGMSEHGPMQGEGRLSSMHEPPIVLQILVQDKIPFPSLWNLKPNLIELLEPQ